MFLDDWANSLNIYDKQDKRRSKAAQAFIAYGENQCREWLAQADGDYSRWEKLADIKQSRKKAQVNARGTTVSKAPRQEKTKPFKAKKSRGDSLRQQNATLRALYRALAIDNSKDKRCSFVAQAFKSLGPAKCQELLRKSGNNFVKWEKLVHIENRRSKRSKRKSSAVIEFKSSKNGKKAIKKAQKPRIKRKRQTFRKSFFGRGKVNATVPRNNPGGELADLRGRLKEAESKGGSGSDFIRASLKERIALLEAEIRAPKI